MAPTETLVQWQTDEIIRCLFLDPSENQDRTLDACLQCDAAEDDMFDPFLIADKLRTVADALNEDAIGAALADLRQAVAEEAVMVAFSSGVEAVCQNQISQKAEVAPEVQLIRASVALGLYVKRSCPELIKKVQIGMSAFLSRRVGTWVTKQGGWENVNVLG